MELNEIKSKSGKKVPTDLYISFPLMYMFEHFYMFHICFLFFQETPLPPGNSGLN